MSFCSNKEENTFCKCIQIYELELNDLVEIILTDPVRSSYSHPMHLHGHSFALIGTEMVAFFYFNYLVIYFYIKCVCV